MSAGPSGGRPLRFHWMLPKGGEVVVGASQTPEEACRYRIESTTSASVAPLPDLDGWTHFARRAEEAGIDSVLISFSRYEPDPITISAALLRETPKLRYMLAYRSGLMQPATFVQQINTLSALGGGRVSINMVAGSSAAEQRGYGDFLSHDERYARAAEFLAACQAFWQASGEVDFEGRYYRIEKGKLHTPFVSERTLTGCTSPEIYVSGHSEEAERLAFAQGTSWLRVIDTPEKVAPHVARARANGVGICLRLCIICRPTREEAIAVKDALLADDATRRREVAAARNDETQLHTVTLKNDSRMYAERVAGGGEDWLNRTIFTGFVPFYGPVWTTLIGTPRELADAFLAYREIGVTEFILSGWPEVDELEIFGREVVPLVRAAEREAEPQFAEASQ
jgi:alkanesulfonate monooxygenase